MELLSDGCFSVKLGELPWTESGRGLSSMQCKGNHEQQVGQAAPGVERLDRSQPGVLPAVRWEGRVA